MTTSKTLAEEFADLTLPTEDVEELDEEQETKVTARKVHYQNNAKTTRIVLDVPTVVLDKFKMLCHLVGETQSSLVTKAMSDYIDDRRELLQQFVELRAKITK